MTQIITITGDLGSGKSTVSHILCDRLKYDYIYTGEIQRGIARRYGMTTTELNRYSETHPEIDREIDSTFRSLRDSERLVVDSRLAWFFLPDSFKVFLKTGLAVSSERISKDTKRESERYASKEEAAYQIIVRKASENKRYAELYGADCSDPANYDLIVDTSFIAPEKAAEIILEAFESRQHTKLQQAFVSPKNLYPSQSVDMLREEDGLLRQAGNDCPVTVVQLDAFDYILDGHKRTSCAIKNNIDLLPVTYRAANSPFDGGLTCGERIRQGITPELFSDWEAFHAFNYLIYPVKERGQTP
jgi:cytidylate kinase